MRSFIAIVIACVIALSTTSTSHAEPPAQPEGRPIMPYFASALVLPVSPHGTGLPPVAVQSFALGIPVAERITLFPEVGMATAFTVFQPAPQGQLGVSARLAERFALGLTGVYRYIPHWTGTPSDSHVIGGFLSPAVKGPAGIWLIVPSGVAYNTSAHALTIPLAFKLLFPLSS